MKIHELCEKTGLISKYKIAIIKNIKTEDTTIISQNNLPYPGHEPILENIEVPLPIKYNKKEVEKYLNHKDKELKLIYGIFPFYLFGIAEEGKTKILITITNLKYEKRFTIKTFNSTKLIDNNDAFYILENIDKLQIIKIKDDKLHEELTATKLVNKLEG